MSYLNRKRWLSRTTLGLAVTAALFAGRAAATNDPGPKVIPYLSHGILTQADADRVAGRVATRKPPKVQSDCAKADTQTSYEPADLEPTPQMWPLQDRD